MSIFISCGEPSGDYYASILIREIKSLGYEGDIWGMTGAESEKAGCISIEDISSLSLMGVSDVIPAIPRLLRLRNSLAQRITEKKPAAVIVVDSPDFHLPLLRYLKKKGYSGKVIYLVPPTVWAWRPGRTRTLLETCDLCLPLFGFEYRFLREREVPSEWTGHPLVDDIDKYKLSHIAALNESRKNVAILPGSRVSEIRRLLPVFVESGDMLEKRGYSVAYSIAPGLPDETKMDMRQSLGGRAYSELSGRDLIASSGAVIAASGTVSVEAMMLNRFLVAAYRVSFISEIIFRLMVRTRFVSMPNIMADKEIYPEFLQGRVTAPAMIEPVIRYFTEEPYREEVHALLASCRQRMGNPGAGAFWARSVMETLKR